jgi:hypothetical protein
MASILFRCPVTGMPTHAWLSDTPPAGGADTYESLSCPACRRLHLVNPSTGKVLGSKPD